MSEPFVGEIQIFSFDFPPRGWAQCNGQLLPINTNQALFSLLGTTYGGNGSTNFALPDFRGRTPMHWGNGFILGQRGGEEQHTLTNDELPAHTHLVNASSQPANASTPINNVLARANNLYGPLSSNVTPVGAFAPNGPIISPPVGGAGAGAHQNMMPYQVLNVCIALVGIYPSRN